MHNTFSLLNDVDLLTHSQCVRNENVTNIIDENVFLSETYKIQEIILLHKCSSPVMFFFFLGTIQNNYVHVISCVTHRVYYYQNVNISMSECLHVYLSVCFNVRLCVPTSHTCRMPLMMRWTDEWMFIYRIESILVYYIEY